MVRTAGDQITVKVGGLSATVQRKDIVPREQEASATPKSLSRQKSAGAPSTVSFLNAINGSPTLFLPLFT